MVLGLRVWTNTDCQNLLLYQGHDNIVYRTLILAYSLEVCSFIWHFVSLFVCLMYFHYWFSKDFFKYMFVYVVVVQAFIPCTWEAEAGRYLMLRSSWCTEWIAGQTSLVAPGSVSFNRSPATGLLAPFLDIFTTLEVVRGLGIPGTFRVDNLDQISYFIDWRVWRFKKMFLSLSWNNSREGPVNTKGIEVTSVS